MFNQLQLSQTLVPLLLIEHFVLHCLFFEIISESRVDERVHELKLKDDNLDQLENIIQDKSTSVDSLRNEVKLIQVINSFPSY